MLRLSPINVYAPAPQPTLPANQLPSTMHAARRYSGVYRQSFRPLFTFGAKVLWINNRSRGEPQCHRKVSWSESSLPRNAGRKFQQANVSRHECQERKFSLWTFRSREQKCSGTKSPAPDTIIYTGIWLCDRWLLQRRVLSTFPAWSKI